MVPCSDCILNRGEERKSMNTILIIDDNKSTQLTLKKHLQEKRFTVVSAFDGARGLSFFKEHNPDLTILDIRMPVMDGFAVLEKIRKFNPRAMVLMITAFDDMESTIKAIQLGAYEYLTKPIDIDKLDLIINRALEVKELNDKVTHLLGEKEEDYHIDNIVGKDEKIKEIFKIIGAVSSSQTTVLIQGESGTGKELIARAIHYNSLNSGAPFIAVNCTALPENLLESELFGHAKGSFTGAISNKKGKFEMAGKGSLFLDEISEMTPNLQVKLLRVLQEREFERVGGNEIIKSEARIIAATNANIKDMVETRDFRDDLYFRLKVVEINVPPLRERRNDIPLLVKHFLKKINRNLHKNVYTIFPKVIKLLKEYDWPGNVRELENMLTRAIVLSKSDVLLEELLPQEVLTQKPHKPEKKGLTLKEVEQAHIFSILENENWNKRKACRILGISRPTLDKKIKEYGLIRNR